MILDSWLDDTALLQIATRVAQPVTAFVIADDFDAVNGSAKAMDDVGINSEAEVEAEADSGAYLIRWFSQTGEINLCGHGSLGAGAAIAEHWGDNVAQLRSKYGNLTVARFDQRYQIELPAWQAQYVELAELSVNLDASPQEVFTTRDLVVVVNSEEDVVNFVPDYSSLADIDPYHAFIVTAQSAPDEYVLRYFAPKIGIPEDIATGSAHCSLAPYWFDRLKADTLNVRQVSSGGGAFRVTKSGSETVLLSSFVKKRAEIDLF